MCFAFYKETTTNNNNNNKKLISISSGCDRARHYTVKHIAYAYRCTDDKRAHTHTQNAEGETANFSGPRQQQPRSFPIIPPKIFLLNINLVLILFGVRFFFSVAARSPRVNSVIIRICSAAKVIVETGPPFFLASSDCHSWTK